MGLTFDLLETLVGKVINTKKRVILAHLGQFVLVEFFLSRVFDSFASTSFSQSQVG
jgi:hypothetical protein